MIAPQDDDVRLDLSALDPDADATAADRFVGAVMERVALRPRPETMPSDPLVGIWSLVRSPALAAGILIVAALGAYGLRQQSSDHPRNIAEAMGVPPEFLASAGPDYSMPPDGKR